MQVSFCFWDAPSQRQHLTGHESQLSSWRLPASVPPLLSPWCCYASILAGPTLGTACSQQALNMKVCPLAFLYPGTVNLFVFPHAHSMVPAACFTVRCSAVCARFSAGTAPFAASSNLVSRRHSLQWQGAPD